jgi:hypothetical protein
MPITKSEWGFKDFLKDALRDVPMTDFPFFTLDEGLNPRIHCEEHTPQNVLDKFNG